MPEVERAGLAAAFAREMMHAASTNNEAAEEALEVALWEVQCFRQALTERRSK